MEKQHKLVLAVGATLCALAFTGCTTESAGRFFGSFLDPQSQLDQWDVSRREHYYRERGDSPAAARRNAEYDFIWENNRFP